MSNVLDKIGSALLLLYWVAGMVLAQPGWLKALAIFFPPYAWYLVAARVMQWMGLA